MSSDRRNRGSGSGGSARKLARYLAQRAELGEPGLLLPALPRQEALHLARGAAETARIPGDAHPADPADALPSPPEGSGPRAETGEGDDPLPREHPALKEIALGCSKCRLAEGRTQVVFHDGNPEGRLMVVGEAPGAHEDRTGLPFVGQAGKLLDLLLASVGLSRQHSVYICNVIKCRPPGNRDPRPDEIEACAPYLRRQIDVVAPEAVLAVGTFAGRLLSGRDLPLGRLRGDVHSYQGVPLVVTYHPAALLRNAGWTRAAWEDLQLLRQVLDAPEGVETAGDPA